MGSTGIPGHRRFDRRVLALRLRAPSVDGHRRLVPTGAYPPRDGRALGVAAGRADYLGLRRRGGPGFGRRLLRCAPTTLTHRVVLTYLPVTLVCFRSSST